MSTDNQIIRLASINAAASRIELNYKLLHEKQEIIKDLAHSKMLIVNGENFSFADREKEKLYEDSFQNF